MHNLLLVLFIAVAIIILTYYIYCEWLNRKREDFEMKIARGLRKVRAVKRRARKRLNKILSEEDKINEPLLMPLKPLYDGSVLLTTLMPIIFSLDGKEHGNSGENDNGGSSKLIECYRPIHPSEVNTEFSNSLKDEACCHKDYKSWNGITPSIPLKPVNNVQVEYSQFAKSLNDESCCHKDYKSWNGSVPSIPIDQPHHMGYISRPTVYSSLPNVGGDDLTVWAVADTGSIYLVCTSDCCKCGKKEHGVWDCSQPGKRKNTEKDFDYGSGDYEGYYWDSALSTPYVPDFEFAVMTKVLREDAGETVSICGLLPNNDGALTGAKSYIDQVFESMSAYLPKSFKMDFRNFNITFGATSSGKRIPFPSVDELSSLFGKHISYKFPFYMVKVHSLSFASATTNSIVQLPHPKYVVLDTGTTLLACGNKYMPSSSILRSAGVITFTFSGPDGLVSLSKRVNAVSDVMQNVPMLNEGPMSEIFICGLVMFIDKVLTFVVNDGSGNSYVQIE